MPWVDAYRWTCRGCVQHKGVNKGVNGVNTGVSRGVNMYLWCASERGARARAVWKATTYDPLYYIVYCNKILAIFCKGQ